jgi:hypothetical protein
MVLIVKKKLLQNTDRKGSIQNEWSGHSSSSIHKGHGKVKEKQEKSTKGEMLERCGNINKRWSDYAPCVENLTITRKAMLNVLRGSNKNKDRFMVMIQI